MWRTRMLAYVLACGVGACWSGGALEDKRPEVSVGPPPMLPAGCGGVGLLGDDFAAAALARGWTVFGESARVASGRGGLEIAIPAGGVTFAGIQTTYYYDLRQGRLSVELGEVVDAATSGQQILRATRNLDERVELKLQGGKVSAVVVTAGMAQTLATLPFDALKHRFWQLRDASGRLVFELSPDGQRWDALAETPLPAFAPRARIALVAATTRSEGAETRVSFKRLNDGQGQGRWCGAASIRDDFDDREAAPLWLRNFTADTCRLEEDAGGLYVVLAQGSGHCAYVLGAPVDLRDSSAAIEVELHMQSYAPAIAIFRATDGRGSSLEFDVTYDRLSMRVVKDEVAITVATLAYDAKKHRWWRLRERESVAYFDTSPDGITWFARGAVPAPLAMDAVELHLQAGLFRNADAVVGEVRFDNLNVAPKR